MDLKPVSRNNTPPQAPLVEPVAPKPVLAEDPFKPDVPAPKAGKAPKQHKSRGLLKKLLKLIIILALLGAAGGGTYYWQHKKVTDLRAQNQVLAKQTTEGQAQIVTLKKDLVDAKAASTATTASTTVVKITELGIQLTVDDSIKDLDYKINSATLGNGTKYSSATLSTASLLSKDSACTADKGVLGAIAKVIGQYPAAATQDNSPGALVKQFADYYISYSPPQAACSTNTTASDLQTAQRKSLVTALNPLGSAVTAIQ